MDAADLFRPNEPRISCEIIDGELIIVDFDTGLYFSSQNVGPYVWTLLSEGISFELITAGVAQRYGKKPDEVRAHVRRFLEELLSENLLVLDPERPCAPPTNAAQPAAEPGPLSFEAPILNRFTDMEEMLLLDPIHDVEESGWPQAKPPPSKS